MALFRRSVRHPFYAALRALPAGRARDRCAALTGTFEELAEAAGSGVRVARAIFPLHRPPDPFLSEGQREALWALFQVPVYAMLLDGQGRVVAYECEVQEGLHLAGDYTGGLLFGTVEFTPCECGRPGPRLLPRAEPARAAS